MKTRFMFPHGYKTIGWIFLVPSAILGLLVLFFDWSFLEMKLPVLALLSDYLPSGALLSEKMQVFKMIETNVTPTVIGVVLIISAILVAFSKEKQEDEFIAAIRLESLLWATYINYALLVFSFLLLWGESFLYVMAFNMFTLLLIFIVRFNLILHSLKKAPVLIGNEKQA